MNATLWIALTTAIAAVPPMTQSASSTGASSSTTSGLLDGMIEDEICDGIDNDMDGRVDEGFDVDGDGVGDCLEACTDQLVICSDAGGDTVLRDGTSAVLVENPNRLWTARVDDAEWIWDTPVEPNPERDRVVYFRTEFFLPPTLFDGAAELRIASDNAYGVWVNNVPAAGDMSLNNFSDADTWDVTRFLQPGRNRVVFNVLNRGVPGSTAETNPGGLKYCLTIDAVWAGPDEVCDGIDNDCDGEVDEGFSGQIAAENSALARYSAGHAVWMPGIARDFVFDPPASLETRPDGTASLTGTAYSRANPTWEIAVDVELSGFTTTPPSGSPKLELRSEAYASAGGPVDPSTWGYYPDFSGVVVGAGELEGAVWSLTRRGPAYQVGPGANGKNAADGGSGWFNWTEESPPTGPLSFAASGHGDFNLTGIGACGVETCNGLDDDGDGSVDEGLDDWDGDGLANCVDPEICNGDDDDGNGQVDDGIDPLVFELGVFDLAVSPAWNGALEFLTNDTFYTSFSYDVTTQIDPAPAIPAQLSPVLVSTIDPNRPAADATERLDLHFDVAQPRQDVVFEFSRYGSETAEVFVDMDGEPVAVVFGTSEGQHDLVTIELGELPVGAHTLSLVYAGGGADNGFYIDALRVRDRACAN